jgi:hypothetical protein
MRGRDLIDELKRKLKANSNREVARSLGMSEMALFHWRKLRQPLTTRRVANAIYKARLAAVADAQIRTIRPIVEYFPLKPTESLQGVRFELFATRKDANPLHVQLRRVLAQSRGIYVFYDSRGRALYTGKATRRSLWAEMKSAFNRDRETQTVYRVRHPKRRQSFKPGYVKHRQPKRTQLKLSDLAAYFSAFAVDEGMIDDLEALLVRNFANDLLNVRMERYSYTRASRT